MNDEEKTGYWDDVINTPFGILSGVCGVYLTFEYMAPPHGLLDFFRVAIEIIGIGFGVSILTSLAYALLSAIVVGGLGIKNPKIGRPIMIVIAVLVFLLFHLARLE